MHGVGDFDSALLRRESGSVPAISREPYFLVHQHRLDQRFDALEIDVRAGERRRVDRDDRMADAGPIAGSK
jgi:hypothetical protein